MQIDVDLLQIGLAITNRYTTKTLFLENIRNTLIIKSFYKLVSVILTSVPDSVCISFRS